MKNKPTIDDLISALYEIWELADKGRKSEKECIKDLKLIEISEICKNILPE